jgi:hypothetical protein
MVGAVAAGAVGIAVVVAVDAVGIAATAATAAIAGKLNLPLPSSVLCLGSPPRRPKHNFYLPFFRELYVCLPFFVEVFHSFDKIHSPTENHLGAVPRLRVPCASNELDARAGNASPAPALCVSAVRSRQNSAPEHFRS